MSTGRNSEYITVHARPLFIVGLRSRPDKTRANQTASRAMAAGHLAAKDAKIATDHHAAENILSLQAEPSVRQYEPKAKQSPRITRDRPCYFASNKQ
jgi:hypothetical protein